MELQQDHLQSLLSIEINRNEYSYDDYLQDELVSTNYSLYGAFVLKCAVCQGYAEAYQYLMKQFGIPCGLVTSNSVRHAWNVVFINNSWQYVDVTFDDPVYDRLGRTRRTYF